MLRSLAGYQGNLLTEFDSVIPFVRLKNSDPGLTHPAFWFFNCFQRRIRTLCYRPVGGAVINQADVTIIVLFTSPIIARQQNMCSFPQRLYFFQTLFGACEPFLFAFRCFREPVNPLPTLQPPPPGPPLRCFRSGGARSDEQTLSDSILEQRPVLTGNIIYLSWWM